MSSPKPKWRQVFDRVERAVGAPLEDVAASDRFIEVMAVSMKVRRVAGGTARRVVGGVTSKVLWAVDAPTRDDVRRLNEQLAALASEVRSLEQVQRAASIKPSPVVHKASGRAARPAAGPAKPAARQPTDG